MATVFIGIGGFLCKMTRASLCMFAGSLSHGIFTNPFANTDTSQRDMAGIHSYVKFDSGQPQERESDLLPKNLLTSRSIFIERLFGKGWVDHCSVRENSATSCLRRKAWTLMNRAARCSARSRKPSTPCDLKRKPGIEDRLLHCFCPRGFARFGESAF